MTHYLVVLALAAGAWGGWTVQGWRHGDLARRAQEAAAEKRRMDAKTIDTAAVGHERDKRRIEKKFAGVAKEVDRVVQRPFYAADQQCLDDDGLQQLRAALAGSGAAAGEPARAVPGSGAAGERQPR